MPKYSSSRILYNMVSLTSHMHTLEPETRTHCCTTFHLSGLSQFSHSKHRLEIEKSYVFLTECSHHVEAGKKSSAFQFLVYRVTFSKLHNIWIVNHLQQQTKTTRYSVEAFRGSQVSIKGSQTPETPRDTPYFTPWLCFSYCDEPKCLVY